MADLAVVIVTWNVRELALQAIKSLLFDVRFSGLKTDVYVIDSASSDGTVEAIAAAFPEVRLTASAENLGFGRANNLALRQIGFGQADTADLPRAVYLLNPDTITQPGATLALYAALVALPRAGLVGAQLAYGDGSFQPGAFHFPGLRQLWVEFFPTPGRFIEGEFNGRYSRRLYQAGQPFPVDFTLGATMMLRREVIQQTGGFDEQFFMYCEEIDWAWRIHKAGWEVWCVPAARVTHLGGQSTAQVRPRSLINLWTSRLQLFRKHYPAWKYALARRLIAAGMQRKMQQMRQVDTLDENAQALLDAYQTIYQMVQPV
ncbi:MAG TPA: glycosyltransferase family 2 protein [Phototrophicaceae bacterium]|nr:glycosyltransferase family 2 protein [Phototrophicaceae bacterium]